MRASTPNSVKPFNPPEECVASAWLADQGNLARADFGFATRYLFGRVQDANEGQRPPKDLALQSVEEHFDLPEGIGRLAWECAGCQTNDYLCKKEGDQNAE